MHAFYDPRFVLPLPEGHRFPMVKYRLLAERVRDELDGLVTLLAPHAASDAEILRVHEQRYLEQLMHGTLEPQAIRRIGFPWSPALVERERLVAGATIEACRAALRDGSAANLAGGTHHAFADHGAGYCVFNDAAIAVRALQAERLIRRALIIDCDVHQGDGTAAIFAGDSSVFTFSIHGARNYPFHKQTSDLDIALPDGADDATYLSALADGLGRLESFRADLAIYIAGADPFVGDRLGRLKLSPRGLGARDRMVLDACAAWGLPVAIVMAGGYAREISDTVAIHLATVRLAAERCAQHS
ncbi:histone deacetylase [Kallotenue papyrolyticum]|uniref:histone deacetylase family protein n=1 Tax=Kallotenue papyrolyticum TaxID=1325125 RepID=UPI000492D9F5|nr:histone deacetylase [Kallotenue papyrolyticum]